MLIATLSLAAALSLPAENSRGQRAIPERPLVELFSADDYPMEALHRGLEGRVHVRFRVGADGRVRDCKAATSSGHAVLDRATCALLTERARYRPARNAQGEAVSDTINTHVRWVLPDPSQIPFQREHLVFRMARAGGATTCSLTINDTAIQPDVDACDYIFGPMARLIDSASHMSETELTLSQVFEPLSEARPEPALDMPGERLLRFEADIEIAADGTVMCTTRSIDGGLATSGVPIELFDPCRNYAMRRFPPPQRESERRARYYGSFYLARRGTT